MCTLWLIEAFTYVSFSAELETFADFENSRAGQYGGDGDGKEMIRTARRMFDELLQYGNHVQ